MIIWNNDDNNSAHQRGLEDDRTIGVRPTRNRFLDLLRLTMLKMILWSWWTFSTEKLNHSLYLGLQVSGLTYKSYSNSLMKSTLPRFPDSYIASKHRCPFLALPECPGGLITTFSTLPSPPSLSLSSESKQTSSTSVITNQNHARAGNIRVGHCHSLQSVVWYSDVSDALFCHKCRAQWVLMSEGPIIDSFHAWAIFQNIIRIQKRAENVWYWRCGTWPATYTMAVQLIALVSAILSLLSQGRFQSNLLCKVFGP